MELKFINEQDEAHGFRQDEISHQVIIDKENYQSFKIAKRLMKSNRKTDKTETINKPWSKKKTIHRKKIGQHQLQLNPG
jgi:hypothetical protein